jgi:hypothetical protein
MFAPSLTVRVSLSSNTFGGRAEMKRLTVLYLTQIIG